MSEFKSQRECWEALLAGKTLIFHDGNKIKLNDFLVYTDEHEEQSANYNFSSFDKWSTYVEPKKKVKIAPVVYKSSTGYWLTSELYKSEKQAKDCLGESFVKWLIGTPYELEVEE